MPPRRLISRSIAFCAADWRPPLALHSTPMKRPSGSRPVMSGQPAGIASPKTHRRGRPPRRLSRQPARREPSTRAAPPSVRLVPACRAGGAEGRRRPVRGGSHVILRILPTGLPACERVRARLVRVGFAARATCLTALVEGVPAPPFLAGPGPVDHESALCRHPCHESVRVGQRAAMGQPRDLSGLFDLPSVDPNPPGDFGLIGPRPSDTRTLARPEEVGRGPCARLYAGCAVAGHGIRTG